MTDNPIVHFDISGPNEHAVHQFYGGLLGWNVAPQGPGTPLTAQPRASSPACEARWSTPLRRRSP
jgi:predicted enzyme related to lactoylglutathione lyase